MTLKAYIERLISLQRKRDYHSAYHLLNEALSDYPTNAFLQASEVYLLFKLGKIKEARQKAEARQKMIMTNPFLLRTYVEILFKDRDIEDIILITERIKSMGLKDERLYLYLANLLLRMGKRDMAVELLQAGLIYMPGSIKIKTSLENLTINTHEQRGVDYYRERYKGMPIDKTISEIEGIIILPEFKDDISIRIFLAELYKRDGNLKKVEEVYLDALMIRDSPYIRKMLGFLYYRQREMRRAFFYLKEAFLEDPDDHALYNTILKIAEEIQNLDEMEGLINEALIKHPGSGRLHGMLKRLKRVQG